jgi:DNA-binding transcriptional regulator YbjK
MNEPARSPQKSRGEERKRQVLDATLRLLARSGPRSVTHRAVAEEAGTSLRATTYYFSSREQLLREPFLHYADGALGRIDALELPLPEDPLEALEAASRMLALMVLSDLTQDRVGLVAEYEWVLEIGRRSGDAEALLEQSYARFQSRLMTILEAYGERMRSPTPEADARIVLATLRGLEVESLATPSAPPSLEELEAIFRRLLSALAAC